MSYIGNTVENQNYVPAIDYFNGDGSTVAFTLSRPVASVAAVQAVISNVPQNPGSAFTVSGSTITFTSAPPSGTNNIYVYYTSPNTQIVQPGQGTVGTTQLQSDLTLTNPTYTGTLTGGTGVVNIGSGQVYKDSSGNVGIGTSSPSQPLTVGNTSTVRGQVYVQAPAGSSPTVTLDYTAQSGGHKYILYSGGSAAGNFDIYDATAAAYRATIDSSGNLLVGTTSGTSRINADNSGTAWTATLRNTDSSGNHYAGVLANFANYAPNSNTSYFFQGSDSAAARFQVFANGGIANYQANNSNLSDRNEKTDFAPAKSYLDVICSIPVQTFKYIDQTDDEPTLGVVAQDVQAVAPELVMESDWGIEGEPKVRLSIYQTDLQYALMKCIQELNAKVDAQAAEIAALKGAA